MRHALFIAMFPALLIFLCAGSPATLAAPTQTVSVDYVIGMLEAGMNQHAIVKSVLDRGVSFTLEPGDLDRLRAAGAGDALVRTVMEQRDDFEETLPAGGEEGAAGPEDPGPESTPHPRRLTHGEAGAAPQPQTGDTCDIYYCPEDYAYSYSYYYPGYYSYYYYPGFYAGYYYPFSYPYGYSYGNHGHHGGHHRGRISPRGAPRGQPGNTPQGGQMSPRGSPRGGSSRAPSSRGSSAPSRPRSPRGGHH